MNVNVVDAKSSTADVDLSAEYVGSAQCISCHQTQFEQWQTSDHYKSMAIATEKTVFGNFNKVKVSFNNIESYFYKNQNKYYVDTQNEDGQVETFEISFTFGHWPLQQYLIKTKKGHIQAFNVAWDNRTKIEGGQKWYHLRGDEKIFRQNIFFWTKHFQNWNSRCADCHSTNVSKNYNGESNSYQTSWSDINVACEACHGGGKSHINIIQEGEFKKSNTGFSITLQKPIQNYLNKNPDSNTNYKNDIDRIQSNMMDTCGGCHSRRTSLGKIQHSSNYYNQYTLQTLDAEYYFANGKVQDEVFEIGSFIQSKMYQNGVTCGNCHNPHTAKLRFEGNHLCLQCHRAETYDDKSHHGHSIASSGSQCVNCHMPATTFMTIDKRRDHSFSVPAPGHSSELGAPDACTSCHQDKSSEWAQEALLAKEKFNKDTDYLKRYDQKTLEHSWSTANQKLRLKDPHAIKYVKRVLSTPDLTEIKRASLLVQLDQYLSQESLELSIEDLKSNSPLVRRSAVASLKNMPDKIILKLLLPMLAEPSSTVRDEIGLLLSRLLYQVPPELLTKTKAIIEEYRKNLEYGADSPVNLLALANLETNLNNLDSAKNYYFKALSIEPGYIPAMVNLADYFHHQQNEKKAKEWLEKAVFTEDQNALAHHALGLHYIRVNNIAKALVHLKKSTELPLTQPVYFYTYAIALANNDKRQAIEVLVKGVKLWPKQSTLLLTLVKYMEQLNLIQNAESYLNTLESLAPLDPQVIKLIEQFQRSKKQSR